MYSAPFQCYFLHISRETVLHLQDSSSKPHPKRRVLHYLQELADLGFPLGETKRSGELCPPRRLAGRARGFASPGAGKRLWRSAALHLSSGERTFSAGPDAPSAMLTYHESCCTA